MPANQWVWVIAIVIVALVVAIALWRGRGADVSVGAGGLHLRTPQPEPRDKISVAEQADVGGEIGVIEGRVAEAGRGAARSSDVDVATGLVVRKGAKIGSITGEKITSPAAAPKRKAEQ